MQNQPTYHSPETYSWESYLQLEKESKLRYEYYDGEIVCLAGASNRHSDICTNLTLQLAPPSQYLRLATVRHYLIVEQTECAIYHYRRQPEGGWEVVFYENMDQTISLPELDAEIAVSAIYEGISFDPPISITEEEMGEYEVES